MGVNNPNLPSNVLSDEEAIQYLASVLNALRVGTYNSLTGSPTVTAAQMVGGVVDINGGTTATVTTDTAVNIIARMVALDANAGVGSTAQFAILNDNSGVVTVTPGTGVTIVGTGTTGTSLAAGAYRKYLIKILTATTVSLTVVG
jgi:hypothetical protein